MNLSCQQIVGSDEGDYFDLLPDEVVLLIFKKLQDARSLCQSMSVCKRFHFIAPQVREIFLPIPRRKASTGKGSDQETGKGFLKNLLMKPFRFVSQMIKPKSENDLDFYSYYVHNEILKPFEEIRAIHLRLPGLGNWRRGSNTGKKSKNSTTFLKWKAEFGRELHSCVILGAKSWSEKPEKEECLLESDQESGIMADEELKLRIVWTISCLIAASARHYLIQETVRGRKTIESVVVSDGSDQGRLCMNKQQIEEMRGVRGKGDELFLGYRSRLPALRMKMWCLERLEVPDSGQVMEGATLVVIRPVGAVEVRRSDGGTVAEAFGEGEVIGEAARKLMAAKKCYSLEMSSF